MSQVKNLRAMFEQGKETTSPQDRGRSPGIPSSDHDSPRPLSTIRTSFIAVEKDGRMGLQRDASRDSSVSISHKPTGEADTESVADSVKKSHDMEKTDKASVKTNLQEQSIPESPRAPIGEQESKDQAEQPTSQAASSTKMEKTAIGGDSTSSPSNNTNLGVMSGKKKEGSEHTDTAKPKQVKSANSGPAAAASRLSPKSGPISSSKTATKPAKPPTVANAPKSPLIGASRLAAKAPDSKVAKAENQAEKGRTARGLSNTVPAGTSHAATKRPPALQSTSGVGFVKPKVKSPTRPVKLPASLTTHTAASGSKVNGSRQTPSGASDVHGRSTSRLSSSTAGTAATGAADNTKNLKRQNSTVGRTRPSLGPPPSKAGPARDHAGTRKEKEVDDGFLARMMRPTQASSSKVADKVPTTPPRKATVARVTPKSDVKRTTKPSLRGHEKSQTSGLVVNAAPSLVEKNHAASEKAPALTATSPSHMAPTPARESGADATAQVTAGPNTDGGSTPQKTDLTGDTTRKPGHAAEHAEAAQETVQSSQGGLGEDLMSSMHQEKLGGNSAEPAQEVVKELSEEPVEETLVRDAGKSVEDLGQDSVSESSIGSVSEPAERPEGEKEEVRPEQAVLEQETADATVEVPAATTAESGSEKLEKATFNPASQDKEAGPDRGETQDESEEAREVTV